MASPIAELCVDEQILDCFVLLFPRAMVSFSVLAWAASAEYHVSSQVW